MTWPTGIAALLVAVVLAGCAPADPMSESAGTAGERKPARTLTMAVAGAESEMNRILHAGVNPSAARRTLFNAGLARTDPQGNPQPYLVDELPRLNNDTWKVLPDGRMETTYRLLPNLTWHDGLPLSAEDFAFAWRLFTTPAVGISHVPPQNVMEEVAALDERTIYIRWRQPYPGADALDADDFPALPRQVLERPFRDLDSSSLVNHPYWTTGFVGLGPYRLERWEPGAYLEGAAFEGYVLGRPKIDRIRLLVLADSNTALANLLAGEALMAVDTIVFQQAMVLKREWEPRKSGSLQLLPDTIRHTQIQIRPELANPSALMDLRVRQALAHSVDKQALIDGLYDGEGIIAQSMVRPTLSSYSAIERAIAKYPYDLRRTDQLMNEAGFAKGSDGVYAHPTQGRFSPDARVRPGADNARELAIMEEGWRRAGIDVIPRVLTPGEFADTEFKSKFPALFTTGTGSDERAVLIFRTSAIPRAENRFSGLNLAGWSNPEYDRLYELFATTLSRPERDQQIAQLLKMVSEEVPVIPLNFTVKVIAHASALRGPEAVATEGQTMWNIHLWELD